MRLIDADEFEKRIKKYDTTDYAEKALYNFAHNEMISMPTALDIQNVRNALSAGVECVEEEAEKIEKIRTEIDEYLSPVFTKSDAKCQECANHLHDDVLQIIDKYAEQEPLTEEDYKELHDRFGDYVEFVVRDMVSGTGERWTKAVSK